MKRSAYLVLFGFLAFQTASYADRVIGTLAKVDAKTDTIVLSNIQTKDRNKVYPAELNLRIKRDAKLKNIASIQDLKNGNMVKADIKQDKGLGLWEAKSIELASPNETADAKLHPAAVNATEKDKAAY